MVEGPVARGDEIWRARERERGRSRAAELPSTIYRPARCRRQGALLLPWARHRTYDVPHATTQHATAFRRDRIVCASAWRRGRHHAGAWKSVLWKRNCARSQKLITNMCECVFWGASFSCLSPRDSSSTRLRPHRLAHGHFDFQRSGPTTAPGSHLVSCVVRSLLIFSPLLSSFPSAKFTPAQTEKSGLARCRFIHEGSSSEERTREQQTVTASLFICGQHFAALAYNSSRGT